MTDLRRGKGGSEALVHLAAPAIRAANVIRQRCAWCGALIDEYDLDRIAIPVGGPPLVNDDGTPRDGWHGLVAVDEQEGVVTAKWAVPDPEDGKIPPDSCMALDPCGDAVSSIPPSPTSGIELTQYRADRGDQGEHGRITR